MNFLLLLSLAGTWQNGTPMPDPGYGFACAAVGNRIYTIGGLADAHEFTVARSTVEAYDVERDTWLTGFPPLPRARGFAGCAVLDGKIYVIGGTDMHTEFRRVDRFDPAGNTWDTVAPLPWSRQGLAACEFQGSIYAIGGYGSSGGGQFCRTTARFVPDGGVGSWEIVDSMESARTGLGVAIAGDRICAVGGWFYSSLSSVEYYLPNQWTLFQSSMHAVRYGLGVVGYGHFICAIAGRNRYEYLGTVELFDESLDLWQDVDDPLSAPRAYVGAAVVGKRIYVIGGQSSRGTVGTVEISDSTPSGIAETPPKTIPPTAECALLFRDRVRLSDEAGRRIEILDGHGRLVAAGCGAIDAALPQGVYFAQTGTAGSGRTTRKVTVIR